MKKIKWIVLLLLVALLTACGTPELKKDAGAVLKVGQELEIDFVKHIKDDQYELGVFKEATGELVWRYAPFELGVTNQHFIVKKGTGISKAVLKREPDTEDGYPFYVLYLPEQYDLQAGSFQKSCGKGCTKTIHTTMLADTKPN